MHNSTLQMGAFGSEAGGITCKDGVPSTATRLRLQVKYAKVDAMDWQTLKIKRTVLGKGHSDTLTNMNNLATALENQGKYAEAEAMHRQTLQLRETGNTPADAAAQGDDAWEGSPRHAHMHEQPRSITSPARQVHRGRGDASADATA
ncbi:hypothetical protein V500_04198 [Pseudogymnoascus sp. VKM F-4518 (FW-2643)]|nr:hypothetical protein V500_04198 [Pseudogymnoascus sp. VKM F-4518 (FW-2643)]